MAAINTKVMTGHDGLEMVTKTQPLTNLASRDRKIVFMLYVMRRDGFRVFILLLN